jgi:hypothetical protein
MGRREVAEENPLAGYSDDGLAAKAESRCRENVGNKIWWLNFWLLVFTVVIAAMTAFCSGLALRTGG